MIEYSQNAQDEIDDAKIAIESIKPTGKQLEDQKTILDKFKLAENPQLKKWLSNLADTQLSEELLVQNLSLDKMTLRILLNVLDQNKFVRFRFQECRLTKNGLTLLATTLAKLDKPGLSLEVSFNPLPDSKDFAILVKDCLTSLILRCNQLDPEFATAAADQFKILQKTDYINLQGNWLKDEGAKTIFDALSVNSFTKCIKAIDFGRNDITQVDSMLDQIKTSELSEEQKAEVEAKLKEREQVVSKSKSKAVDTLPPVIDSYVEFEGKFLYRNNQALEQINLGENKLKDYKPLLNHLPAMENFCLCYKSDQKLQREDKKVIIKMLEQGKLIQYC